jgi:predicted transposase/invertase (TIGR01784 family)
MTGGGKNNRTLHDAVFRQYLSQPDVARDFMMLHLPPALKAICQLDSLKLESGSFIDDDLRAYYSDVLYSLKSVGGHGVIYILIEHQSSPDRHMAFRLLRYAIAVMKRHLDLGHKTLPLVVPILFYQGKATPYPYSLNWLEAFGDLALAHWLYTTPFPLVDITIIPDEEIMTHRRMAMLTLLQKHIRQRDLAELLEPLVSLLIKGDANEQPLTTLINYMLQAGECRNSGEFMEALTTRAPEYRETFMTIAEQWREEGHRAGHREGVVQGKREVARDLLKLGLPLSMISRVTGFSEVELRKIKR